MRVRRRSRRIRYVLLGLFVGVTLFTCLAQRFKGDGSVDAASLAGFDPGYIISDYQMGNYTSMSEAEIQAFLTAKNPCSNTNYEYYKSLSAGSSYKWHFKDGHFVCLSEELFGDGEVIGKGETAAHILWQTAQDYKINPQVLIVLLQKETGLITDPIPNDGDYRKATGYGCPDTAPCSSEYYGFKNQVRRAAALFRTVLDGGWTNYPLGNNYIQYNPNAACGGSVVNIRSLATSALYRYTPYQPNAGALAAGYGTASCGAYGNRNFYLYFEDWFGGITNVGEAASRGKTLEDGTYRLVTKSSSKAITVKDGALSYTGDLQMADVKTTNSQSFAIKYEDDGYYSITNPATGLAFDVKGAKTANSTHVGVFQPHGNCNQDWTFEKDSDGYYTIISRCSGRVLDATSLNNVVIFDNHGGDNQKWELVEVGEIEEKNLEEKTEEVKNSSSLDGVYQFVSKATSKVIGVKEMITESKGNLGMEQKTVARSGEQSFVVKYESDGYYSITNYVSGLAFDIKGAKTANSTHVGVFQPHGNCNQDWTFEKDSDGYYTIISRCSGRVLDATSLNNVVIFDNHGGDNQKWKLVKVEAIENLVVKNGNYQFVSKATDKVISIKDGVLSYTGDLQMSNIKSSKTNNQTFTVKREIDGYYSITNSTTGLAFDVKGAKTANSTHVGVFQPHDNCNQDWTFEKDGDGYYTIISRCSGRVLDATSLNNVVIFDNHGGDNQKWKLVSL